MDKEYHRLYKIKWRKKNKEKIKIDGEKYRRENKDRIKEHHKKYYKKNKKIISEKVKIYRKNNKEKVLKQEKIRRKNNVEKINKYGREHYKKNKERIMKKHAEYRKRKRAEGGGYAISLRLRSNLLQALKKYTKTGKHQSSKKYGIDYEKIINHLKPFPKDITKYHIDHIKPLCSFDLNNPEEIKKAFAPENHQWLLARDNQRKSGKYKHEDTRN